VEAAMVVIAEIGDFRRFKHSKQLIAYLGLVPCCGGQCSASRQRDKGRGDQRKCWESALADTKVHGYELTLHAE